MPIFEYICNECRHGFEMLVRNGTTPECPSCHGTRLEKQLSVFAASVKSSGGAAGDMPGDMPLAACGTCGDPRGPGSCSLN